jgi:hypothetical protein
MADVTHSDDPTDTPVLTDLLTGLGTGPDNENYLISAVKTLIQKQIQLDTGGGYAHTAGQLSYDVVSKTGLMDTGFSDVRINLGQEEHVRFFNDTGDTILNGTVINAAGVDATNSVLKGIKADASSPAFSSAVIGIATHDVPDGTVGLATAMGEVRDFDTTGLSVGGPVYLSETAGILTSTRPKHPSNIVIMGSSLKSGASDGIFYAQISPFSRTKLGRSFDFTSQGVGADTFWKAGYYDWNDASVTLTQASTTQTYGVVGRAKAAHPGIVPSGAGTVDTGQVGLQVTGTLDSESNGQTATQTQTITEDITTLTADVMAEAAGKFSGQVTFELYVVSGSPTAYSLEFNYGYSKYEDFDNVDYTITSLECIWRGGGADTSFDIALRHHKPVGWEFAASGFEPGNGDIIRRSVDQAIDSDVANGEEGSWERLGINTFIEGSGSEGVLIEVATGSNNSMQGLEMHIGVVSESLT